MPFDYPEAGRLPHRLRQPGMSSVPYRPPMPKSIPMDDHLPRSMPGSPYDMDPRDPRIMSAPFDSRMSMGVDGPDYFSPAAMGMGMGMGMGIGQYGRRGQGSPFPPGFEPETLVGTREQYIDELVRRTNLMVQYVNSQIRPASRYCQLQPKMDREAKFPPEFRVPKTVEDIKTMDPSSLDRVLRAYGLPIDLRSLRLQSQDSVHPRAAQQAKLCTLFDFLGATQISERQRMRVGCKPY
ncbi:hypothetical protein P280DRAFT_514302 [Massarina eburnea CBS 473.64]|uniref:Uncharacterized protein n=1 Tax=Massarina eburnea CBS 473.64 TaxID=1395130 RepID=A0A6A6SCB3_9PLEO|nr:hypothetical protein P280DRAFT_514302 [Massarina eburnea CBS 473.64]